MSLGIMDGFHEVRELPELVHKAGMHVHFCAERSVVFMCFLKGFKVK